MESEYHIPDGMVQLQAKEALLEAIGGTKAGPTEPSWPCTYALVVVLVLDWIGLLERRISLQPVDP